VLADNVPDAIGQEDHLEGLAASLEGLARFVGRTDSRLTRCRRVET
jgi:hypothetical protein